MNKQRYLSELQSLLVFMTEEDRELAVRHYGDIFDAAGENGTEDLVRALGSPTKAAIALSRGYEPGNIKNLPQAPAAEKTKAAFTQLEDDPWGDLPTFEIPSVEEKADREGLSKAEPTAVNASGPEPVSGMEEDPLPEAPEEKSEPAMEEPAREEYYERSMPLGAGIPLLILVMVAIGVPLAALALVLAAVCLAPGGAVVFGAYLIAVGGIWCLSFAADAILLFGGALLVLAIGLAVLFGGVWLASRLFGLYARGVAWLCGELLGRKVTEDE